MQNPAEFVRVSTPAGHFSVPAAVAEAAGSDWKRLKHAATDDQGNPLPPKLRDDPAAATPTPEPSATVAAADINPEEK